MKFTTRKLDEWPWQWIRQFIPNDVDKVLLPIGNMEAHGIIPLGTDTLIPRAIAEAIADDVNALIAPPVPYGLTSSLRHYPGSMTMPSGVFKAYVTHILHDLALTGFREIYILNGHGGQSTELRDVARRVHHQTGHRFAVIEWWELEIREIVDRVEHPGGHGGTIETAMIQAIIPDAVHDEFLSPEELAPLRRGVSAYPFPGSIMQIDNEPLTRLDAHTVRTIFQLYCRAIRDLIHALSSQWRRIPFPENR